MAGQQNSSTLRKYRRNAHSIIGTKESVSNFSGLQTEEAGRFLLNVLDDPKPLKQHLNRSVTEDRLKCPRPLC
jgi:hypothetical protein